MSGCGRCFTGFADGSDRIRDSDFVAFAAIVFNQDAIVEAFDFHGRLVGFDFSDHVTVGDCVTFVFEPADQRAHRHGVAEFGHIN